MKPHAPPCPRRDGLLLRHRSSYLTALYQSYNEWETDEHDPSAICEFYIYLLEAGYDLEAQRSEQIFRRVEILDELWQGLREKSNPPPRDVLPARFPKQDRSFLLAALTRLKS
jgi:hypothetical protein